MTWGAVIQVSPMLVRVSGDTVDTPVAFQNADVVVSEGDRVLLGKAGAQWVIICVLDPT
jgi:hypothetical protein